MRDAPRDSRMAPSVHAYTAAMRAASEGGRWEAALAIWEDMQTAGCKPTGAFSLHLCMWHPPAVLASAGSSECRQGPVPQPSSLPACGRTSQLPPPFALSRHSAGHAYAAVISACAAGGQWQKAVALFDEMLAWGVRPDVVSCTALITGEAG